MEKSPLVSKSGLLAALMAVTLFVQHAGWAQATPQSGQTSGMKQAQDGMANAGPHKAEFDSEHRPITAGGFVKSGPIVFQDVAQAAGLTSWHHTAGRPRSALSSRQKAQAFVLLTTTMTAGSTSIS